MNKFDGHHEQILQCIKCGQIKPKNKLPMRHIEFYLSGFSSRKYCPVCQNEEFIIVSEET